MTRVLHTARISNVDSVLILDRNKFNKTTLKGASEPVVEVEILVVVVH